MYIKFTAGSQELIEPVPHTCRALPFLKQYAVDLSNTRMSDLTANYRTARSVLSREALILVDGLIEGRAQGVGLGLDVFGAGWHQADY